MGYWTIRNYRDLRMSYEIMHELIKDGKSSDKMSGLLYEVKKAVRGYYKEHMNKPVTYLNCDIDGAILLYELNVPADWDKEDVVEWFEENEMMHCMPSMYDCTGQQFTSWYKVFKRRGKWMTYHSIGIDV